MEAVSVVVGVVVGVLLGAAGALAFARGGARPAGGTPAPADPGGSALETLPDAVLQLDGAGVVVASTRMAERLIGRGSLVGVGIADLVPQWSTLGSDTAERVVSGRGADLGERWTVEVRVGKGAAAPVELQRVATADGWWVVLRDHASHHAALERVTKANANLTEARDRALTASRAKTATLGRVAQSLRTPLTAIAGYGDLLVEELGERGHAELVSDAERIRSATDALEAVLQTLLDWSEIEAGRMEVTTTQFDLAPLLDDVAAPFRQDLAEGSRTLELDVEADLRAVANPDRVGQIVGHLLRNAVQHGASGAITLKARRWDQSIGITVRDQGPGLSTERLGAIFGAGGQEGTTGTGVSLHVAQVLASKMGGRLSAESEPGKGAAFTLVVKAAEDPSLGPPMLLDDED